MPGDAVVTKSEDVARAAGVSRATVSQILNGHGRRFSDATRERVLRAAEELKYQPSVAARALATGASDIVIALLPYTELSGNLQALLERVTEDLARHGFTLVLQLRTENPDSLERLLVTLRPRAVITLGRLTESERAVLALHRIPGLGPTHLDDVSFGFDRLIGRAQAEHLITKGYRQLAYVHIHDERFRAWGAGREAGVREVCTEQGLEGPLVLTVRMDGPETLAAVDAIGQGTGVACYNDDIAIALLMAATARGRQIPGDFGLIGMDASALAEATHPGLSTVRVDVAAAADNMIGALLIELGIRQNVAGPQHISPQIIERESA